MKIYTKSGDQGKTSLYGGERVEKDHLRISTYGTLDELNGWLGLARTELEPENSLSTELLRIQGELFQLGAELATPRGKPLSIRLIASEQVLGLEHSIDAMESKLSPLTTFILPGGSRSSALLHCARTVARRAERELISLHRAEPVRPTVIEYLNRLSDYFFVAARFCNHLAHTADVRWEAPKT